VKEKLIGATFLPLYYEIKHFRVLFVTYLSVSSDNTDFMLYASHNTFSGGGGYFFPYAYLCF